MCAILSGKLWNQSTTPLMKSANCSMGLGIKLGIFGVGILIKDAASAFLERKVVVTTANGIAITPNFFRTVLLARLSLQILSGLGSIGLAL